MPRYIDADKIEYYRQDKIGLGIDYSINEPSYYDFAYKDQIDLIPDADVQEVRHSSWHYHDHACGYYMNGFICNSCGYSELLKKPYCANCGAKMDGVGE